MLKAVEDINQTKKRLRIEIPSDLIEREIKNSLEKLRPYIDSIDLIILKKRSLTLPARP